MPSEPAAIRPYRADDLADLYRICLLTADNGQDATPLFRDPQLPGELYAAPYATFQPSLAFVAGDAEGVGGYVVAALDTQAFEQQLERDWWPHLRVRYPEAPPREQLSAQEQFALHDIHHPWSAADELASRFPSHLHIDLLPRLQGRGVGRRLMATVISALRAQGSAGLHLHVSEHNQKAAGFYRHLGFSEVPSQYVRTFTLDLAASTPALSNPIASRQDHD